MRNRNRDDEQRKKGEFLQKQQAFISVGKTLYPAEMYRGFVIAEVFIKGVKRLVFDAPKFQDGPYIDYAGKTLNDMKASIDDMYLMGVVTESDLIEEADNEFEVNL